jgi:ATP-binding cassette subfamily B multidrug efflux pump
MSTTTFELPKENPLRLVSYLKKYSKEFWIEAVAGIIYNTVIVAGPILLGRMLDAAAALENTGITPAGVQTLLYLTVAFVLVTIFFQYMRYVKRWYLRNMTNKIACDMRAGLFKTVLNYPMARLDKESVGDLMSRTVGDVDQIVATVQQTINESWDTWLLMISYFVVILYYDWRITLICSIPIPFAILVAETVRHPLYRFSLNSRKAASVVNSHLQKTLSGIAILRLFGRERVETERLKDYNTQQMHWNIRTALLQNGMMPVYATLASLGVIGVIGLGGAEVVNGNWTIGRFVTFLTMFSLMATRTWVAARVFNQWHAAKVSWDRIKAKLADTVIVNESSAKAVAGGTITKEAAVNDQPSLAVEDLSFTFPNGKAECLKNISLDVKKGDFIGVTGPVGSGKSALAMVLTGIYPYTGKITVGGRDLTTLTEAEKAATFAYSGQDAFLFSVSIGENITFAPPPYSEEIKARLDRAVYIAALKEDMALFPKGLETVVGERGIRLSGGQRQRIAVARAIFTGNPVIILDDPFSAVDIGTERRMIERIHEGLKDTTVIVFSHRLAAFTEADKIMVLDKGTLAECGNHASLMASGGIYQKIYTAQTWMEREAAVRGGEGIREVKSE